MIEPSFAELLNKVYSWWPICIEADIHEIEQLYESRIAPCAKASGSRLAEQLDWIVYGAVCSSLRVARVVRIDEIRKDYLQQRFHQLLRSIGVPQLRCEAEPDGSFDLAELREYLNQSRLE